MVLGKFEDDDGGRHDISERMWTRIDWMPLPGMAPYGWAYCMSASAARNDEAAESTHVARRESPRSGCNGFPFSRMQRRAR